MEKVKEFLNRKSYGFYVTLVAVVLTIVTAIVYANSYASVDRYMSWTAVGFMIAGAVLSLVFSAFHWGELASAVLAVCNFVGLLQYITKIYNYVVIVMVGIDINTLSSQFISCTVLFAILTVISIANVFFKQNKSKEEISAGKGEIAK